MLRIDFPADEITAQCERAQASTLRFAVEFLQDVNEHLVYATPFKTGNLRGSWYAGLNSEPAARDGSPDPGGGGAIANLNLALASLQLGDVYYAVNGASYAAFVEYGTRHFMGYLYVTRTVNMAGIIAEQTAARIAAENGVS